MPLRRISRHALFSALAIGVQAFLFLGYPRSQTQEQAVELRFDPADGHITVPVLVDGTGPYHFLLDTGIRGAISHRLANSLGLPVFEGSRNSAQPSGAIGLGRGGINRSVRFAAVKSFKIGPLEFERPWNLVLVLGHLPVHADGLLGYNVLKDVTTMIDYPRGWVRFSREPASLPGATVVPFRSAGFILPGDYVRHLIFLDVRVNGRRPLPFVLDTGTDHSVISSRYLAEVGIPQNRLGSDSGIRGRGLSGEILDIVRVRIDSLSFAGFTFRDVELASFDLGGIVVGDGYEIAGLIGIDLLRQFVLSIDFRKRQVAFLLK